MIISMFIFSKNKWASLQVLCLFRRMIYPLVGCIRLVTHRAHGGPRVTPMIVAQLPGLNSLGILMVRTDYAPWRLNPPHTHPKATEILIVLEGSLHFGFVTSNLDNCHITKVLQKGNVFVFPGRTCSLPTQHWKHKYWAVNPSVKPLQVLFLDQNQTLQMIFLPRHSRWTRALWISSKPTFRAAICVVMLSEIQCSYQYLCSCLFDFFHWWNLFVSSFLQVICSVYINSLDISSLYFRNSFLHGYIQKRYLHRR